MTNVFFNLIIVNREIWLNFKKTRKQRRKEIRMADLDKKEEAFKEDFSEENGTSLAPSDVFGSDGFEQRELPAEMKAEGEEDRYYEVFEKNSSKNMGWSVASMILGIASVASGGFGLSGLITGILALIFAVISRKKLAYFNGKAVAGLILGIFGAVFGIVLMLVNSLLAEDFFKYFFEIIEDATESSGNIETDF